MDYIYPPLHRGGLVSQGAFEDAGVSALTYDFQLQPQRPALAHNPSATLPQSQTNVTFQHDEPDADLDSPEAATAPNSRSAFVQDQWDRAFYYSPEGIAELRARWQAEQASLPMAPPPPEIFSDREAAIKGAKSFADGNGYRLTISHSYRDKDGENNRILLACEMAGKYRNHHRIPQEERVRNRQSRKTGCKMKVRLQKKRFSDQWVLVVVSPHHNHASFRGVGRAQPPSLPDLDVALYDWHVSELAKGEVVHGNTIKARALALFAEMSQYRGQDPPNLDREWLDQYRVRHNLPGKVHRPGGPPELVDWSNADAAANQTGVPTQAINTPVSMLASKEAITFAGLEEVFPNGSILDAIKDYVRDYMSRYDASHDFQHIVRVFSLSRHILQHEMQDFGARQYNAQVVLLTALLHDVGDHKYQKPGENPENQIAELLLERGASPDMAMRIQLIAKNVSFSNEVKNPRVMKAVLDQHPELAIVQDADRLDAIGAVGIGRTFAFGGAKQPDRGLEATLEHFTEKLERLEGMMKTETGRRMARERTQRLQVFRQWWDEEHTLMV